MRALSEVCGWRCGKVLDIHVQASYGYLRETHYRRQSVHASGKRNE